MAALDRRIIFTRRAIMIAVLCLAAFALAGDDTGEVRVLLVFTQNTGPTMLNKIQADIGVSKPENVVWVRGASLVKELPPESYTFFAKNAEVCALQDCTPCPDREKDLIVTEGGKFQVVFRWKAHYERVEKKWTCQ
ncbi:MAG TPA: hypothetical protein PK961_11715 [bacterium]|nr:hypothetical protein [bacterium]